MSFNTLKVTAH